MLVNISFRLEFVESAAGDLLGADQLGKFLKSGILGTEVQVVKESILFVSNVDKGGIQPLYNFFNVAQVNVTYRKFSSPIVFMEFNQLFVAQQGNPTSFRSSADD